MACMRYCYPLENTIAPGEHIDASATQELRDLLDAVDTDRDVTADGPGVNEIDDTALRLLAALAVQTRSNGRRMNRISPSKGLMTGAHPGVPAVRPGPEAS